MDSTENGTDRAKRTKRKAAGEERAMAEEEEGWGKTCFLWIYVEQWKEGGDCVTVNVRRKQWVDWEDGEGGLEIGVEMEGGAVDGRAFRGSVMAEAGYGLSNFCSSDFHG